jgi:hypothetical protein
MGGGVERILAQLSRRLALLAHRNVAGPLGTGVRVTVLHAGADPIDVFHCMNGEFGAS